MNTTDPDKPEVEIPEVSGLVVEEFLLQVEMLLEVETWSISVSLLTANDTNFVSFDS